MILNLDTLAKFGTSSRSFMILKLDTLVKFGTSTQSYPAKTCCFIEHVFSFLTFGRAVIRKGVHLH